MQIELVTSKRHVAGGVAGVLGRIVSATAIVVEKNDEGFLAQTVFIQRVKHLADGAVDGDNHATVDAPLGTDPTGLDYSLVVVEGVQWRVRRVEP